MYRVTGSAHKKLFNPFPNKPWFLRVCSSSLLKTLGEKEKLLVTSNFSFSHSIFYPFGKLSSISIKFKIGVCKLSLIGRLQNLSFGKGLIKVGLGRRKKVNDFSNNPKTVARISYLVKILLTEQSRLFSKYLQLMSIFLKCFHFDGCIMIIYRIGVHIMIRWRSQNTQIAKNVYPRQPVRAAHGDMGQASLQMQLSPLVKEQCSFNFKIFKVKVYSIDNTRSTAHFDFLFFFFQILEVI